MPGTAGGLSCVMRGQGRSGDARSGAARRPRRRGRAACGATGASAPGGAGSATAPAACPSRPSRSAAGAQATDGAACAVGGPPCRANAGRARNRLSRCRTGPAPRRRGAGCDGRRTAVFRAAGAGRGDRHRRPRRRPACGVVLAVPHGDRRRRGQPRPGPGQAAHRRTRRVLCRITGHRSVLGPARRSRRPQRRRGPAFPRPPHLRPAWARAPVRRRLSPARNRYADAVRLLVSPLGDRTEHAHRPADPTFAAGAPLPGGIFVLVADGADGLAGPDALRDALRQVPLAWPLLLDLRGVEAGAGPDARASGSLPHGGQRLRARAALAVVAGPRLLAALRANGLSRLVLLHDSPGDAAAELWPGPRDPGRPIAYRPRPAPRRSGGTGRAAAT